MGNLGWDGDETRTLLLSLTDWSDIATVGSRRAIRAAASASTDPSKKEMTFASNSRPLLATEN